MARVVERRTVARQVGIRILVGAMILGLGPEGPLRHAPEGMECGMVGEIIWSCDVTETSAMEQVGVMLCRGLPAKRVFALDHFF